MGESRLAVEEEEEGKKRAPTSGGQPADVKLALVVDVGEEEVELGELDLFERRRPLAMASLRKHQEGVFLRTELGQ